MTSSDADQVILSDPRQIRALVHPARLVVVNALYGQNRQLTATEAARLAGISPSAMSYHLRALERAGIAKRAAASGDGRERPWVRAASELSVRLSEGQSYAAIAATGALLEVSMSQDRAGLVAAMERRDSPERRLPLDEATVYRRESLVVTLDEARQLNQRIGDLLAPYAADSRESPPESAAMLSVIVSFIPDDSA